MGIKAIISIIVAIIKMITKINTAEDVKTFAKQLISEGTSFHPDDDFNNYINMKRRNR